MQVIQTSIPDVLILEPTVHHDARGFAFESFNAQAFRESTGVSLPFVQDNHSKSFKGVLRGLHYQLQQSQGKLVRVIAGAGFDVAVDIRRSSPTFGRWTGVELTAENKRMVWIPPGFAHGFLSISDAAEMSYQTTDYWAPQFERCILWNDPAIGIEWPLDIEPQLSAKDKVGKLLADAEVFA